MNPNQETPAADALEPSLGVLTKHHLKHVKELRVGRSLLTAKMDRACSADHCGSTCCGTGVWADLAEQRRILEHVPAILKAMDPDQPRDPAAWFDETERRVDPDFASGEAVGTTLGPRGCIFLDLTGKCALQKATMQGLAPVTLKPFYCFAFPITIDRATVMVDIDNVEGTRRCCVPSPDGERSIVDVFAWELEHVLGKEGLEELRGILAAAS